MPRVIWKGAISFGLVHVPVALYPASQEIGIDFDWLDKRTMDPVGYKRINKRTGKEIDARRHRQGHQAGRRRVRRPERRRDQGGLSGVDADDRDRDLRARPARFRSRYLEKPYYLAPIGKGEKVYALLREAMREAGVIGIARVVMHTKEHLAALIPDGAGADAQHHALGRGDPAARRDRAFRRRARARPSLKEGELKMASQLIGDMTGPWKPDDYADKFTDAIHALAAQRVKAGKTEKVTPLEDAERGADRRATSST